MGIASGRVSFRRYRLGEPRPRKLDDALIKRLREHAFGASHSLCADGIETGWIAPTHIFDTKLTVSKVGAGRFVHLAMRLDRTAAPPTVVRSYRRMEELAALQASGRKALSKQERQQAAEAAEARAQKEARQGAFRRISVHPVLLDLSDRTVYLASLGSTVDAKFRLLFADTFGATLTPVDSAELASSLAEGTGRHRQYEDAVAFHLVDPPGGEARGNASFDQADRSFLGREFLTWLWHAVETGDGTVALTADGRHNLPAGAAVAIDRVLQLDCDFQVTGRDIIYHDGPAGTPEAKAGLRSGKQPRRAGLILAAGGDEYSLVLDALRMQVSGLGLPDSDEPDPAVRLEERCQHIVRLAALLDGLFAAFLKMRFSREFHTRLGRIRSWAQNGNGSGSAKTSPATPGDGKSLRIVR